MILIKKIWINHIVACKLLWCIWESAAVLWFIYGHLCTNSWPCITSWLTWLSEWKLSKLIELFILGQLLLHNKVVCIKYTDVAQIYFKLVSVLFYFFVIFSHRWVMLYYFIQFKFNTGYIKCQSISLLYIINNVYFEWALLYTSMLYKFVIYSDKWKE